LLQTAFSAVPVKVDWFGNLYASERGCKGEFAGSALFGAQFAAHFVDALCCSEVRKLRAAFRFLAYSMLYPKMITHICDRCGRPIFKGELRYTARIEVFAAPDSGEITIADLLTDQTSEIGRLIAACEKLTEEELMRDVHFQKQFDLCRPCQKAFVTQPLGALP